MKVAGLVALQDFTTVDSSGVVRGVAGEELRPLMYSTAERLVKGGFARRKRVKAVKNTKDKEI